MPVRSGEFRRGQNPFKFGSDPSSRRSGRSVSSMLLFLPYGRISPSAERCSPDTSILLSCICLLNTLRRASDLISISRRPGIRDVMCHSDVPLPTLPARVCNGRITAGACRRDGEASQRHPQGWAGSSPCFPARKQEILRLSLKDPVFRSLCEDLGDAHDSLGRFLAAVEGRGAARSRRIPHHHRRTRGRGSRLRRHRTCP